MAKRVRKNIAEIPYALYVGRKFWGRVPAATSAEDAIKKFVKASNGTAAKLDLRAVPLARIG